ncbi:MAG: hypothetical protein JWN72_2856 [Thermoleophilia bacterium]|nr:hypothetical protein [Thermoleophilia bacterium]
MNRPPLWQEHRDVAEVMGEAIALSLTPVMGSPVELGIVQTYTPETMLSAVNFPQRATVVRFSAPVRDALIVLSSLSEELSRACAEAAAQATLRALDISPEAGSYVLEDTLEYADVDQAVDEWDALFLEATYDIGLAHGDLRVVLGTGLLESANCHVNGVQDPFGEGMERAHELLGTSVGLEGDDAYALTPNDADTATFAAAAAGGSPEPSLLEQLDAELAAEEAMAAAERAALAAMAPAVASSASAVAHDPVAENSSRWASLLSGVEVELSAELGRTDLPLGDITSLNSESVLTLDQMVNEPVTVYVNGTPYATARLVVVDGEYGIEIIEVMEQTAPFVASLAA